MGAPLSVLGNARAFARDYARDEMPPGYLWDVLDFVPSIIDTTLTGRGAWGYGCAASGFGDIEAGILASFKGSEQLLVQTVLGHVLRVNNDGGGDGSNPQLNTLTDLGAAWRSVQNPVQLGEDVIHFDRDGVHVPQLWREGGGPPINAFADMGRPRVGTIWKGALVSGGGQGPTGNDEGDLLRFSVRGADLATAASFDTNSNQYTSARITALQATRSMVLIFHPGSIERLRGGPFPDTTAGIGGRGLVLDTLSDRVGCINPQTVAPWNDQVVFADAHGVHLTDGAVIKNLTTQGGISTFWRLLYEGAASVCASCFLDYYVISFRHPLTRPPLPDLDLFNGVVEGLDVSRPPVPPLPPDLPPIRPPVPDPPTDTYTTTLVCDLNRKAWFRMSNMNSLCLIASAGSSGMERLWGGLSGYARLGRFGPVFFPPEGVEQIDANGVEVRPRFETAWYRLGQEGRKRVRFAYLSYDCYGYAPVTDPVRVGYLTSSPTGRDYAQAGVLPTTSGYRRLRVPINKFPYGIAFYVETIAPTGFIRVYDLAVEAGAAERSRV